MIKNFNPRFGEIGKIKIGGKGAIRKSTKGDDYRLPVRYEHFVITTTEKGPDGNYLINSAIMKQLGEKPKEIPIRLLFDDIDMNFHTEFQYYQGSKLICHGDGETAECINNNSTEKKKCDPETCKNLEELKCKVSGILSCYISTSMEIGGVYRFRTHSWNTVSNILAALKYFKENTNGILQGLPLKLKFIKKATQEHGNVNTVTIVLDGVELMKMRELALFEFENRMKLGIDMKLIENKAREAGFMVDTDDPKDVEDEFYTPEIEEEKKGCGSEDVKSKLETKAEEKKEPPKVKDADFKNAEKKGEQGSLL